MFEQRVRLRQWAVCVAAVFAGACYHEGERPWFDGDGKKHLAPRAGFDLGCPASQLEYAPLGNRYDGYEMVGVTGCGKKAVYVWLDERGWVLNTANRAADAGDKP